MNDIIVNEKTHPSEADQDDTSYQDWSDLSLPDAISPLGNRPSLVTDDYKPVKTILSVDDIFTDTSDSSLSSADHDSSDSDVPKWTCSSPMEKYETSPKESSSSEIYDVHSLSNSYLSLTSPCTVSLDRSELCPQLTPLCGPHKRRISDAELSDDSFLMKTPKRRKISWSSVIKM